MHFEGSTIINIKVRRDADALLSYFKAQGYTFSWCEVLADLHEFKNDDCVRIEGKVIKSYGSVGTYSQPIISAKDFLRTKGVYSGSRTYTTREPKEWVPKVGDRVRAKTTHGDGIPEGATGTFIMSNPRVTGDTTVEYDIHVDGHDGSGGKRGHCWHYSLSTMTRQLEPIGRGFLTSKRSSVRRSIISKISNEE